MNAPAPAGPVLRLLQRAVDVRPEELRALGWSWLYIFLLLSAYYVLRPLRDEMGVAGGVRNLPWLFTATLVAMIAVNPLFSALVARLTRVRFISAAYRFFVVNLILFAALLWLADARQNVWIGRVFFVWVSVFNLFVVSVFWSLMVDVFDSTQGKRLFGFIAAGATLGGIAGAGLTSALAARVPAALLLLASALLLECALFAVRRLSGIAPSLHTRPDARNEDSPLGGSALAGMSHALRSPYLLGVSLFMLLFTVTATFLYFQQAEIARANFADRGARTAFFARIDLWVNVLTLGAQLFLTGRVLRWIGVGWTLATLPLLSIVGFGVLAASPTLAVLVAFQVLRRAGNYAFARPTRELLYTVLPREDKYKAKSFIDTVVYRLGDQIGAWAWAGLAALGLGIAGVAVVSVPLCALWLANSLWLGRRQGALATDAVPRPA